MSIPPWHLHSDHRAGRQRSFEGLPGAHSGPPDTAGADAFLADRVDALTAPAIADELVGLTRVRATYSTLYATQQRRGGTYRRRPTMRFPVSPRIATALTAGVLGLGGFGAAAYAGALPPVAQQVAHHVIGAPNGHPGNGSGHPGRGAGHSPQPAGSPAAAPDPVPVSTSGSTPTAAASSAPAGPDPSGAAAFGLCNAYARAGDLVSEKTVAFANLATAAGGADQIEAYCATVTHPGSATASHPAGRPSTVPSEHPTGKQSTLPSHPAGPPSSEHPTGKPSAAPSHPAGPPSSIPSPSHPTGRPSSVPPASTGHPTGH